MSKPPAPGEDPRWFYEDGHWVALERSPKQVRVVFAGETIADSRRALLLRERGFTPRYYFPKTDVRTEYLKNSAQDRPDPHLGPRRTWDIVLGDSRESRTAGKAAWSYPAPPPQAKALADHISLDWNAMDAWFEEDEQIFCHPRDPYVRIDCLKSSRHVEVFLAGEKIAESHRPVLLFETGLPVRYYLPREDVRLEWLTPSSTETMCPYKGTASYFGARIDGKDYPDVVWSYLSPIPECAKIEELLCFHHERVDAFVVDGEPVQ